MTRFTPFLIVGMVFFLIITPYLIYTFLIAQNAEIGEVLWLFIALLVFVFLLLDRILIRFVRQKILNFIELVFLFSVFFFYIYSGRQTVINVLNPDIPYLMVIENNGNLQNTVSSYRFPFSRIIETRDSIIVVKNLTKFPEIHIPTKWAEGYVYDEFSFPEYPKILLFLNPEQAVTTEEVKADLEHRFRNQTLPDSDSVP